jgi:hypothetical protein
MVDWPVVRSGRAVSTMIGEFDEETIKTEEVTYRIKEHMKIDIQRTISLEEHLVDFDIYMKVETRIRSKTLIEIQ